MIAKTIKKLFNNDGATEKLDNLIQQLENIISQRIADRELMKALLENDVVYLTDMDTNELIFLNKAGQKLFGEDYKGKKCYKVLQNLDKPCPFCTNATLRTQPGVALTWVFQNTITKRIYLLQDVYIRVENGKTKNIRFEKAIDITHLIPQIIDYWEKYKELKRKEVDGRQAS